MNKLFENEILENWGGIKVLAEVEETADDANLAIKYNDHGDEFILVRMKDGRIFEYGYYLNREGCPDPKDIFGNNCPSWYKDWFVRKPHFHYEIDERSFLANEMHFYIKHRIEEDHFDRPKKEYSQKYAQIVFDEILWYIQSQKSKRIMFDKNSYKNDIRRYLEVNGICTDENVEILNNAKFDTRIDGADGIAGKRILKDCDYILCGDEVERIIINGKEKDPSKISMKRYLDDDWHDRFGLSLRQFR